jgi:hypothetical protein
MSSLTADKALAALPSSLRDELLNEYRKILQNYLEHRWQPSELSAGIFCEIVYTIVSNFPTGKYPAQAKKPKSMVDACRALESVTSVPRSFQILIPRLLPALYEIRNNRGVGHVGGDVDSNHMDATVAVSLCKWILAELIRVFHSLSIEDAQALADAVAERTVPIIWESPETKRILDPSLELKEQILLFLATSSLSISRADLRLWTESKNRDHFNKVLKAAHKMRLINLSADGKTAQILPPGTRYVEKLLETSNYSSSK